MTLISRIITLLALIGTLGVPAVVLATVDATPSAALVDPFADAGAIAPAPPVVLPDPETDPAGWAEATFRAVTGSEWIALAALLLMGVVWCLRQPWALARWVPFFATDRGG